MTQTCPKCGHARRPSDTAAEGECPRCGIIYAKYRPPLEPVRADSREAGQAPAIRLSLPGAVFAAAAVCAILITIKGATLGAGPFESLMLVPFFLCFVPVLTYVFGAGLYSWNKTRMRFDLYDSQAHPVLSKVFFVFYVATSVTFALMFFAYSGN